jgi:hypothetical protein
LNKKNLNAIEAPSLTFAQAPGGLEPNHKKMQYTFLIEG